jgi:hypothetical protein
MGQVTWSLLGKDFQTEHFRETPTKPTRLTWQTPKTILTPVSLVATVLMKEGSQAITVREQATLFPPSGGYYLDPKALPLLKMLVFDPENRAAKPLQSMNIPFEILSDPTKLPLLDWDILLVGPNALNASGQAFWNEIKDKTGKGRTALFFEQNEWPSDSPFETVEGDLAIDSATFRTAFLPKEIPPVRRWPTKPFASGVIKGDKINPLVSGVHGTVFGFSPFGKGTFIVNQARLLDLVDTEPLARWILGYSLKMAFSAAKDL